MDIESAFIGNCLADPDNFHRVRSSIKTVYLQEPKNKSIWKTMELLANRNITINKTSVFQELSKKSRDKEALRTYLNSLVYDKTLKTSDYAKMITQDGQVRLLKQNLPGKEGFIDNWFSEGGNVDDFVDKEIENLLAVRSELEKEATTSQDDEALYQELLEIQRTKQSITGIRSGIQPIDYALGGFKPGTVTALGAGSGLGKTWVACSVINRALTDGYPVTFFEVEMLEMTIRKRMAAIKMGNDLLETVRGNGDPAQLKEGLDWVRKMPLTFHYSSHMTPSYLNSRIRADISRYHTKLVVVDHLQLLSGDTNPQNLRGSMVEITHSLKNLAIEYNIAILVFSQFARRQNTQSDEPIKPTRSMFKESGSIETDFDNLLLMWRPFGNSKFDLQRKCLEIIVDKAREGEENVTVALWHNPKTCRIEPPPTEVVQEYSKTNIVLNTFKGSKIETPDWAKKAAGDY